MVTVHLSKRLADEIMDWAKEQRDDWPDDTDYQMDLADLFHHLDAALPSAEDVRGILADTPDKEPS